MTSDQSDASQAVGTSLRRFLGSVGLAAATMVILNVFAAGFVSSEHTLYRADQLAYWEYSSGLASDLRADPFSAVQKIAWSVAHSDLNLLPALPISCFMVGFGDSRATYILAVVNIYGLAVVLALLVAMRWLSTGGLQRRRSPVPFAAAVALLWLPALWRPVLIGYLGLGGVALGLVILTLYLREDPAAGRWEYLALIGFLVAMLALFRRWYAFWVAAFFVMIAVDTMWQLAKRRSLKRNQLWRVGKTPVVIGLAASATLLALATPLILQRLSPGYAQEFVAYTRGAGLGRRLGELVGEFGLVPIGLTVAAAIVLVRRSDSRRIGVLLPLHMVVTYALMVRLQDHGPHHWYLYLACALLLVGLAALQVLDSIGSNTARWTTAGGLVAAGLVVTTSVYGEWCRPMADALGPLVPRHRVRPLQRADLAEVQRLLSFLDQQMARRDGYVYVLGSTGTLSDQSLAFANRSLGTDFRSPPFILQSAHVDRRDGFPRMLLEAEYVVVPDPPQNDMNPSRQRVVMIPTRSFVEGRNIANAFRRLPVEFLLEGDVHVWVFERERPIEPSEIQELSGQLREVYPDRPDIWQP